MNFIRFLPVLLLAVFIGLYGFTISADRQQDRSSLLDKPLPEFSLQNAQPSGLLLSSATIQKPALLVFWASWCGVCRVDMPILSQFAQKHDIQLYGIAYRDDPQALQQAIAQFGSGVRFAAVGRDDTGDVAARYALVGVPTLFAIDRAGIIRRVVPGQVSAKLLDRSVLPVLH